MEEELQTASVQEDLPAETETQTGESPESEKKKQIFNDIMEILETMLTSVFVILLLFTYLIRPVTVDGRSMLPTLHDGDRLVMFRLFYTPSPGDVVVVNDQEGHILDAAGNVIPSGYSLRENIIKRVIAVAGQQLEVNAAEGAIYIDGVRQDEPYINEITLTDDKAFSYPITIPEGYIFVMGDNRNHSTDSRNAAVGLVQEDDVLGRAFLRYYAAKDEENPPSGKFGFVK